MATVEARQNESFGQLLKRFRKKVQNERILSTARRNRFFMSNSEKRRKARLRAIRRQRRREHKEQSQDRF